MAFNQYDPSQVSFTFKGVTITGYQDGTFIDAEREADGFTDKSGSQGDVVRTRNLDRRGKVTLTLQAQAASNDVLQAFADQDEQFPLTGPGVLQVMDHQGNQSEVHAEIAWIMKRPKFERGKESGPVVWVFKCAQMEINNNGNIV